MEVYIPKEYESPSIWQTLLAISGIIKDSAIPTSTSSKTDLSHILREDVDRMLQNFSRGYLD